MNDELYAVEDQHTFSWGTHFHLYKWDEIKKNKRGEGPRAKCTICTLPASHDTIVNSGESSNR